MKYMSNNIFDSSAEQPFSRIRFVFQSFITDFLVTRVTDPRVRADTYSRVSYRLESFCV